MGQQKNRQFPGGRCLTIHGILEVSEVENLPLRPDQVQAKGMWERAAPPDNPIFSTLNALLCAPAAPIIVPQNIDRMYVTLESYLFQRRNIHVSPRFHITKAQTALDQIDMLRL